MSRNQLPSKPEPGALVKAAQEENLELIKDLISQGTDINEQDDAGFTALIWASWMGYVDIVKFLVDKGADVNKADHDGSTPLIHASWWGYPDIIQVLLDKGAVLDERSRDDGCTALMEAARHGHREIVQLFVSRGAVLDIRDKYGLTARELAGSNGYMSIVNILENAEKEQKLRDGVQEKESARESASVRTGRRLREQKKLHPPKITLKNKPPAAP